VFRDVESTLDPESVADVTSMADIATIVDAEPESAPGRGSLLLDGW